MWEAKLWYFTCSTYICTLAHKIIYRLVYMRIVNSYPSYIISKSPNVHSLAHFVNATSIDLYRFIGANTFQAIKLVWIKGSVPVMNTIFGLERNKDIMRTLKTFPAFTSWLENLCTEAVYIFYYIQVKIRIYLTYMNEDWDKVMV
jgi:hypothetical protein